MFNSIFIRWLCKPFFFSKRLTIVFKNQCLQLLQKALLLSRSSNILRDGRGSKQIRDTPIKTEQNHLFCINKYGMIRWKHVKIFAKKIIRINWQRIEKFSLGDNLKILHLWSCNLMDNSRHQTGEQAGWNLTREDNSSKDAGSALFYYTKGGLISESFSLWLKSPKMGAKSRPWSM